MVAVLCEATSGVVRPSVAGNRSKAPRHGESIGRLCRPDRYEITKRSQIWAGPSLPNEPKLGHRPRPNSRCAFLGVGSGATRPSPTSPIQQSSYAWCDGRSAVPSITDVKLPNEAKSRRKFRYDKGMRRWGWGTGERRAWGGYKPPAVCQRAIQQLGEGLR